MFHRLQSLRVRFFMSSCLCVCLRNLTNVIFIVYATYAHSINTLLWKWCVEPLIFIWRIAFLECCRANHFPRPFQPAGSTDAGEFKTEGGAECDAEQAGISPDFHCW